MPTRSIAPAPVRALERAAHQITGHDRDYDDLIELARRRRVVLIGEASHGTHEFYAERARITRRLIDECGFTVVAAEADWPDAHRVDRYVTGRGADASARAALLDFRRFPAWMWRNVVVLQFVEWLRRRNDVQDDPAAVARFAGLDLYSLRASIEAVIRYLDRVDPQESERARRRYSCFDHIGTDGQRYGFALAAQRAVPCEDEVVAQLIEIRRRASRYLRDDGRVAEDDLFFAEQNARVVRDAEEYYQQMYRADVSSWNLRDRHMAGTLDALLRHFGHQFGHTKAVVWEHNSHVGDARATGMSARGECNVGQLVRQRFGRDQCLLIGLTTYHGAVTAASHWGEPAERKNVRPALIGSHEALLHEVPLPSFWLPTAGPAHTVLSEPRLERAIGVVYRPETERQSHYIPAHLAEQFDVVIHIDQTTALEPLERTAEWDRGEPPETFPTGI